MHSQWECWNNEARLLLLPEKDLRYKFQGNGGIILILFSYRLCLCDALLSCEIRRHLVPEMLSINFVDRNFPSGSHSYGAFKFSWKLSFSLQDATPFRNVERIP